jgi:Protein of unknown function (DUF1236)
MRAKIGTATLAIALIAGAGIGWSAANDQQTNPGSSGDTQHVGSEPPSSVPNTPSGAQAAPAGPIGASGDTMPAKYSEKNAADDKLPLGGYRLKHLTDAERQAIYRSVSKGKAPSVPNRDVHAEVGNLVPNSVSLQPLPGDITAQIPDTRDLKFVTAQDKVVLVDPVNMMVVGVLGE